MNSEIMKIYCGVKYDDKDKAKKLDAKWDIARKGWYFQFNYDEFMNNEDLHTFQFKPFSISFIQPKKFIDSKIINHKTIDLIFEIAKNRNIKYIKDNHL